MKLGGRVAVGLHGKRGRPRVDAADQPCPVKSVADPIPSYAEIASWLGISKTMVQKIEQRALDKMAAAIKSEDYEAAFGRRRSQV